MIRACRCGNTLSQVDGVSNAIRRWVWTVGALLLVWIGVGGCDEKRSEALSYPYRITTTVGMVGDIVRNVAGDRGEVRGIIGEGVDPHLYKPTRSDVQQLQSADIIFYSGLLLEGRLADTLETIAELGKPAYAVTSGIDESTLLAPPGFEGHYDPHVWMDVQAWMQAVHLVAETLAGFDPRNAAHYRENAKQYLEQLEELDQYARQVLQTLPEKSRVLVTAHDAFNYFGRAYGLEVVGIQGISTESEAGLEDINRLVDLLVERDIRAVFVETSVADKNVRALIEGAASRGHEVTIGGTLFSDAMGEPGTYEGTYVGMLDHNVTVIARGLGGTAPARGMQNKLNAAETEE